MYHAIVTKPQHTNPTALQPRFTPFIINSRGVCCMGISIHFNRKFLFKAIEIKDEWIDQMLPPEFKSPKFIVPELMPQLRFGDRGTFSVLACKSK